LNYVFVKQLPDGRISLHDEMRRMVNEYVWPQVDPDRERLDNGAKKSQTSCHALPRADAKISSHF